MTSRPILSVRSSFRIKNYQKIFSLKNSLSKDNSPSLIHARIYSAKKFHAILTTSNPTPRPPAGKAWLPEKTESKKRKIWFWESFRLQKKSSESSGSTALSWEGSKTRWWSYFQSLHIRRTYSATWSFHRYCWKRDWHWVSENVKNIFVLLLFLKWSFIIILFCQC